VSHECELFFVHELDFEHLHIEDRELLALEATYPLQNAHVTQSELPLRFEMTEGKGALPER
jgi:hypothetical protein